MKRPSKLALFVILTCLGLALGYYSWQRPKVSADRLRELATWGLADFLSHQYPGSRALVVSNPYVHRKGINKDVIEQEESGLLGLNKGGLEERMTLVAVAYPELKDGALEHPQAFLRNPTAPTPLSFLVTTNAFNQLAEEYPDCDLWISLIGMPVRLDMIKAWSATEETKFALLLPDLRLIGGAARLKDLVESDKLVAMVLTRPGIPFDTQKMSGNMRKEFDRRFILVTASTIDQLLDQYPDLLKSS